jgi:hypothetical protein
LDLGEHAVTVLVPLFPTAEDEGAFAEAGEMDVFRAGSMKLAEFAAQSFKKCEFEAVASGLGSSDERDGYRGREWLEFFRNGLAADLDEHLLDALEEIFELEETQRAFVLKIEFYAAFHLIDEREFAVIRSTGSAEDSFFEPRGIVIEHLVGADLESGAVADE